MRIHLIQSWSTSRKEQKELQEDRTKRFKAEMRKLSQRLLVSVLFGAFVLTTSARDAASTVRPRAAAAQHPLQAPYAPLTNETLQETASDIVIDTLDEDVSSPTSKERHHYEQQLELTGANQAVAEQQAVSERPEVRNSAAEQASANEPAIVDHRPSGSRFISSADMQEPQTTPAPTQVQTVGGQQLIYGANGHNWFAQISPPSQPPQQQQQQQQQQNQWQPQHPTSINAIISDQQPQLQQQQQAPLASQAQQQQAPAQQVYLVSAGSSNQLMRKVSLGAWFKNLTGMLSSIFSRQRGGFVGGVSEPGALLAQPSGPVGQWVQVTGGSPTPHWLSTAQTSIQAQQYQQQQQLAASQQAAQQRGFQVSTQSAPTGFVQIAAPSGAQGPFAIALANGAQLLQYQPNSQSASQQQGQASDLQTSGSSQSFASVQSPQVFHIQAISAQPPASNSNFIAFQPLVTQHPPQSATVNSTTRNSPLPVSAGFRQPTSRTGGVTQQQAPQTQAQAQSQPVQSMPLVHYSRFATTTLSSAPPEAASKPASSSLSAGEQPQSSQTWLAGARIN